MPWTFLGEVEEESLTAGEWQSIYLLANRGLPHAEIDVDPLHCPTCRIAHAVVLCARESPLAEAMTAVLAMPATALIDAFDFGG